MRITKTLRNMHERGDTIVEVLIAIAIISLILTTAYVITSKNTAALQNNAERVQAQHMVESQIEALKANNGISGGTCFTTSGTATSGSGCDQTTEGSGATYTLAITSSANTYAVSATWTGIGSSTQSNVTLYYKLK